MRHAQNHYYLIRRIKKNSDLDPALTRQCYPTRDSEVKKIHKNISSFQNKVDDKTSVDIANAFADQYFIYIQVCIVNLHIYQSY